MKLRLFAEIGYHFVVHVHRCLLQSQACDQHKSSLCTEIIALLRYDAELYFATEIGALL